VPVLQALAHHAELQPAHPQAVDENDGVAARVHLSRVSGRATVLRVN
jgi:hypothetical protein